MTESRNLKGVLMGVLTLALLGLTGCLTDDTQAQGTEQLYVNGQIYTVRSDQPWVEAMLVKEGVITAIGSREEVALAASSNASLVDLQNRFVMPGIHDVHVHPLEAASDNFTFTLNPEESDPENYAADIRQALDRSNREWLLGWGFDLFTLLDAQREPIEILDDISTSLAIVVMEQTSHSVWVNSKALELAGIDGNTPDPTGGVIMKDERGDPNGLLIDNAGNLIVDRVVTSIPDNEENDYFGLIEFALPELARNGITSVCDARTYWKRNHHQTWKRVADEGRLTVRVNLGLWLYPDDDDQQISAIRDLYEFDENSLLKINQIKVYSDGIVINTTSAMEEDFRINLFGFPVNRGLNYFSEERLTQYIAALTPLGFDFHIHAIGNRGVREALNAIEESGTSNGRHRLTHVEYVNESDYPRFAQLNVTADAQVAGDFAQPHNWGENDELVSPSLNENIIPIKSLSAAQARLTLSSDWDVSTLNPFVGIQNAVTRSPQEISLSEAIKSYTINGAYVMRQERLVGTLEVGKEADFVVLDQNLFNVNEDQIANTQVMQTYLRGQLVYQR